MGYIWEREGPKATLKRIFLTEGKVVNLETLDGMANVTQDRRRWRVIVYALCNVFGAKGYLEAE